MIKKVEENGEEKGAEKGVEKSVVTLLKGGVPQAAGAVQVCAEQDGGCEAAIHAMNNNNKI